MWAVLDFKLVWEISKNKNMNYHIQLRSTNLEYMINTLFPYFSLTYGEKYIAMYKLIRIAALEKVSTVLSKIEMICLVYSLTSGGQNRVITLKDKLVSCIDEGILTQLSSKVESIKREINNNFAENTVPFNICFILGFFLGDGSLYIRIRDKVSGLVFIPKFEIKQKKYS